MTPIATHLFWATAHALSQDLKVFLLSGDDERCLALTSAGAKELIYLSPNEAPSESVKVRLDYKERASSKDLLIDPEGAAPLDEVARLLKKKGAYLCGVAREMGDAFAHQLTVTPTLSLMSKAKLTLGEGESRDVGDLSSPNAPTSAEGEAGEPLFYLYATDTLPTLPALSATMDAPEGTQVDSEALRALEAQLKAHLKRHAQRALRAQLGVEARVG